MRRLLPAALLLVAAPALGKAHRPASEAAPNAVAEVPLYGGLVSSDPYWYVEVQAGEGRALLRLTTEGNALELTEAGAGKLGAKVSGKEGKKKARLDSLSIGAATLDEVEARIVDGLDSGGLAVDGRVSFAAFPELAWAILPSKGLVRVGPASSAAEVLGELASGEGTPAADLRKLQDEKVRVGHDTTKAPPPAFVVPVTWSGVAHRAVWALDGETTLAREAQGLPGFVLKGAQKAPVTLPEAPSRPVGPVAEEWRAVGVAGATVEAWVHRQGVGLHYLADEVVGATVGNDVARRFDQGYDPASNTLRLAPAATLRTQDYRASYEAALRKALEPAATEGEAPDADAQEAARLAAIGPLAAYLEAQGRHADAIPLRQEVVDGEPEKCASWLALGEAKLAAGEFPGAAEAFGKADSLYAPWAALPLAERQEAQADFDKAEKKDREWTGTRPQPHACHVAVGRVAQARLLGGEPTPAGVLYAARLDLDPGLALAAGTASLRAGKQDEAQAAYLQAVKLAGLAGEATEARLGLFLVRGPAGIDQVRPGHLDDPALVGALVEASRAAPKGAVGELQARVSADPGNPVLAIALAREQRAAGDGPAAEKLLAEAARVIERRLAADPQDVSALAASAWWHLAVGRSAEARKAAQSATTLAPTDPRAWSVLAEVAEADGQAAEARRHRVRAAALAPSNPLYVTAALR